MKKLVLVFTALSLATEARAQFPDRVNPGVRVRVWVPDLYQQESGPWRRQLLRGTVSAIQGDTLRITVPGTEGALAVPRSSIRRLEVSKGPPSRFASAFERAVGGAIGGAIIAALENDANSTEWPAYNRTWRAAEEGAKWGAAIGAVIGFVLPYERWSRVRLR